MNILVLSAVLPFPLYSGGQVRLYNLLKRLSCNHTITLVSYIRNIQEQSFVSELSFCHRVETIMRGHAWQIPYLFKALTTDIPLLLSTYDNNKARELIKDIIEEESIDVVHLEPGYVFLGLPHVNVPVVVSEHNIEHTIYEGYVERFPFPFIRPLLKYDVNKLKRWEDIIWHKAQHIITVSETDANIITQKGLKNVTVVSNGVDDEWFAFKPKPTIPTHFQAVFIGNFRWIQNQEAVKTLLTSIWPVISNNYPKATLELVGQYFPQSLLSYVNRSVRLTENVDDIREVFSRSHITLAPIAIGGGTKYKILEAMASGVPVISTSKGIEGLDVVDNQSVIVADSMNQWVSGVGRLCEHSQFVKRLTAQARKKIETNYSWSHIADIQDAVWEHVYHERT